jgi:epoxide hydrolase 4
MSEVEEWDAVPIATRMVAANGLTFEVDTCGEGDRLALCLHGFPEHAVSWRHQLPMLARLGYRAWAPNQRGYGRSSRPPRVADYRIDHLLGDVAALIDASGAHSTVLIGHDWGAAIAWYFAAKRIRPLDALIILNVPHPACFREKLSTWRQLRKSWYIFWFQVPFLPEWSLGRGEGRAIGDIFLRTGGSPGNFPDSVREVYRAQARMPGALTAMLNWYRAAFRSSLLWRSVENLPVIETPTLLIWGENDVALDKSTTEGTDRFVRNLTMRYLPGVSHWVQQDAPEAVNAMIEAFLTGRAVPEYSGRFA